MESTINAAGNISYNPITHEANDNAAKLMICEVAKSSYSYWVELAEGNGNPAWETGKMKTMGLFGRVWNAIKVGAVDAYGFVIGGWRDSGDDGIKDTWHASDAVHDSRKASQSVNKYL